MKISILIKALNEEALIAKCLESALAEVRQIGGEIILVDSLSIDRTVEIASRYPVRIIQFIDKSDCGCATAVQLAYQYAKGEFLYILDADMMLYPGFLALALNYLEANPQVAGVAGKLLDTNIKTVADKKRSERALKLRQITEVSALEGGGLYRRSAIDSVGYFAHRSLKASEEAELGARLKAAEWSLIRLADVAVVHQGHHESNLQMIRRLWNTRRMHAYGVYLRSAFMRPWWWLAVQQSWFVFIAVILHTLAIILVAGIFYMTSYGFISITFFTELLIWCLSISALTIKKKSLSEAFLSVYAWHCFTAAAIIGFIKSVDDPMLLINGRELKF